MKSDQKIERTDEFAPTTSDVELEVLKHYQAGALEAQPGLWPDELPASSRNQGKGIHPDPEIRRAVLRAGLRVLRGDKQ